MLLYQMLPEKVANDLKNGRQVEAGNSFIHGKRRPGLNRFNLCFQLNQERQISIFRVQTFIVIIPFLLAILFAIPPEAI